MAGEQYITVGKLGKPHGLRGAFRFSFNNRLKNKKKWPKHFLMETGGSILPWFVSQIELTNDTEGIINFEDITGPEKARSFSAKELLLREAEAEQYFRQSSDENSYLVGYVAMQENDEPIGLIEEVSDSTGQVLLSVNKDGKEIIIPLVDEFVISINKKKKEIVFDLPEGLLDL